MVEKVRLDHVDGRLAMNRELHLPTLAQRLRTLRELKDLTQVDVAVAVGTSRSNLTKAETGVTIPGRDVLMALATFYEVSLDWLVTGEGEMKPGTTQAMSKDEALLLYAFRSLPEAEAKPLLEMLLSRVKPPGH